MKFLQKVIATCVVSILATAANAQDYTMKIGHTAPPGTDDFIAAEFMKSYIEARSGGRIAVELYPASQLGNFRELAEQVQLGALEVSHSTVGGIAGFTPELQVTDLPYMLPGDLVAEEIATSTFFTEDVRDLVLKATGNVRLATVSNTGRWRSFFTTDTPVHNAGDLKGVKMRTINSPLQIEFVNSLGANATPVSWGELYTSLQTGVVKGTKNAITDIVPTGLSEVINYGVLDEHAYLYGFWWISDSWLKALPEDLQVVVMDGIAQGGQVQTNWNKENESNYLVEFVENGGTIYVPTTEDRETFLPAREAMKDWFIGQYSDEWVIKYETAIAEAQGRVDARRAITLK